MHVYVEPSVYARLGLVSHSPHPSPALCVTVAMYMTLAKYVTLAVYMTLAMYITLPNHSALTPPAFCLALPNPLLTFLCLTRANLSLPVCLSMS